MLNLKMLKFLLEYGEAQHRFVKNVLLAGFEVKEIKDKKVIGKHLKKYKDHNLNQIYEFYVRNNGNIR